jgi:hypothetical protein
VATVTEKVLYSAVLSATGPTTVYTVPGATRALIKTFRCKNKDGATSVTVTPMVHPGADDLETDAALLAPGEIAEFAYFGMPVLEAGDTVRIQLSVGSVNVHVYIAGAEVT